MSEEFFGEFLSVYKEFVVENFPHFEAFVTPFITFQIFFLLKNNLMMQLSVLNF
jgi:hypothetical protein